MSFTKLIAVILLGSGLLAAKASDAEREYNLLRNTRLVAGLQSGWMVTGFHGAVLAAGEDVNYGTDDKTMGPSGFPAFLIDVVNHAGVPSSWGMQDKVYFYTEPFKVTHAGTYTASVYVRGDGEGSVDFFGAEQEKYTTPFSVQEKDGWTRLSCAFPASGNEKRCAIRFCFKGRLWFDSFQVNPGTEPLPYRSEEPAEVALVPQGGELEAVRIQFEDIAPGVKWIVTGAQSGDVLKGQVVDLNGTTRPLPDVQLKGEKMESGSWNYVLPGLAALGQFRVETWVEDTTGAHCSDPNEMVLTRLKRPRFWGQDAPDSPFGVHVQPSTNMILMAKAFGMNWVRLHDAGIQTIGWTSLESAPGQWHFVDREIDRYRDHHLSIVGQVGTAPQWQSYASKAAAPPIPLEKSVTAGYFEPLDLKDYADYVQRVTKRYQNQIHVYDVWNEPWSPLFFSIDYIKGESATRGAHAPGSYKGFSYINSANAPEEFARLQKTAFDTIKAGTPAIQVIGINTTGSISAPGGRYPGDVWSTRVAAAGALNTLDIVGYHLYTTDPIGFPGDAIEKGTAMCIDPLGGIAALKKAGHPVWLTEGSPVARKMSSGFYNYTLPYKDDDDYWNLSDRMVRFYTRTLACGAEKVFLYSMGQSSYFGQKPSASVLLNEDEFPHPTAVAASNFAWNMEGTHFRRLFPTNQGQGTAHLFDGPQYSVMVLIPRPDATIPVPRPDDGSIAVEDIFGNPPSATTSATTIILRGPKAAIDKLAETLGSATAQDKQQAPIVAQNSLPLSISGRP